MCLKKGLNIGEKLNVQRKWKIGKRIREGLQCNGKERKGKGKKKGKGKFISYPSKQEVE